MEGDSKFVEVLRTALEKARNDEIVWRARGRGGVYRVDFPASAIEICYWGSEDEPDHACAELYNAAGQKVIELVATEGGPQWDLLRSLHAEARRSATGWDRALVDAEAALSARGRVGESKRAGGDENEIPF